MSNSINQYECSYCGSRFRLKNTLIEHLIKEHRIDIKIEYGTIQEAIKKLYNKKPQSLNRYWNKK